MNLKNTVEAKEFHTTQRDFIDNSLSEFQAFRDALKVYRNDLANDVGAHGACHRHVFHS